MALLVPNILNVAWEVTIRNTRVMFLPDELARFISYERLAGAFPVIGLPKEDWSPSYVVFGMMVSPGTVVSEGYNIQHGQLLPFWCIMHFIYAYCINSRKHTKECLIARAELILLVEFGIPVDLATYIFVTVQALFHELLALL